MRRFTVALDGPAAAGKGTIARALAQKFGFAHLDTGLLYRAVGVLSQDGADPGDVAKNLRPSDLENPHLRSAEAADAASRVAVLPEVRAALIAFQRDFARRPGGAVLDGRDIGTVICPWAEVKLYITASAETRAYRRSTELGEDYATTLAAVQARDLRDSSRSDAPLKAATDAHLIDTTELSIEEAITKASRAVETRFTLSQG